MNLNFVVNNQILKRTDNNIVVGQSQNYVYCEFEFQSDEWNDIKKFAIFKDKDGRAYNVLLKNNKCLVPCDVLLDDFFRVSVYGGDLITTTEVVVIVVPSGYTKKICKYSKGSRDVYVQAFEELEKKIDDIIYVDNMLHIYANGRLVKKVQVFSDDIISELLNLTDISPVAISGSYNDLIDVPSAFPVMEHTHVSDDVVDFEERTATEIKKSYRLLSSKIRSYGE